MNQKTYDIGIYGLWYGRNYGSISTYYALKTVVESLGYTTVMVENPLNKDDTDPAALCPSHPRRFALRHYELTPRYGLDDMYKLNDICRGFLLGSDQMWNYYLSKPYRHSYFLDFAADDHVKAAYATSFGKTPYNGPAAEKPVIRNLLQRFNAVSVRDAFSLRILKNEIGITADQVLDPVFLCPPDAYEQLIAEEKPLPFKDYIFAYILDPNPNIGRCLENIIERTGKTLLIAFDENEDDQAMLARLEISNEKLVLLPDPPVGTWMAAYKGADLVVTNSFHGVCFSVIFRRPFIVQKNMNRGGARFDSLLGTLDLMDRMAPNADELWHLFERLYEKEEIDYDKVESLLAPERERGISWLKRALKPIGSKAVTAKLSALMCAGCGACVSACPKDALSLKQDKWGYYRSAIDDDKCVNCGRCAAVCPAISLPQTGNTTTPSCWEFISSNDEVLRRSSSGGVFTHLARRVFDQGGAVAGAAWNDDLTVSHILIRKEKDLHLLRKSKYLQSYMGTVMRDIKALLDKGKPVLFTGTPCQVSGLRKYLGRDYKKLICVDLLCGNAPSADFFKKYLNESFGEDIAAYEFRYKSDEIAWDAFHTKAVMKDGREIIHNGLKDDHYQRVYHNHTMCAVHCEKCRYQAFPRVGDLTIGDFWGISGLEKDLDTFKGVSMVLCNNEKGAAFFKSIPPLECRVRKEVPLAWMGGNGYSRNGGRNFCSPQRNQFYKAITEKDFGDAVNFALKPGYVLYRDIYEGSNSPLIYDALLRHFRYEHNIWEEVEIGGRPTLIVKQGMWRQAGHYARLPLTGCLKPDRQYIMSVRFKVKTLAGQISFHVIDSGSKNAQLVHTEVLPGGSEGLEMISFSEVFTPDADYYDEFMIGARHVSGPNNFISFAYISIIEA